jgi:hypothetical protein
MIAFLSIPRIFICRNCPEIINYFYRNGRNLLPMTAGLIKQLCADLLEFVIPECIYREIQARPELDRRLKHSGVTPLGQILVAMS